MKNYKGFALLEGLLILLIIGMLAGVGYYVYDAKKNSENSLDNASKTELTAAGKKTVAEDPTKDWKAYSNKDGQFSLKHPASWVQASSPELCSEGLLLIAANAASVGTCASEDGGQMQISSQAGDLRSEYQLKSANYPDLKTESVTVAGVAGEKQSGTYKADEGAEGPGPSTGEKKVTYIFYTNSRTYQASYWIKDSYPDVLADFNTMVTKTLKFQP